MHRCDCMLSVGVLGINHKTADLELREAVARAGESLDFFPQRVVVLSTCNRTEIYFSDPALAEVHCDLLSHLRRFLFGTFEYRLYSYFGVDCLSHLCHVTAGLDSAIIAETEIQRQVKCAYTQVCMKAKIPSALHFLFQKALKVAKGVRSRFIPNRGVTLSAILWELILAHGFEQARTLFVGNSQVNRELIGFCRQKGMRKIDLCSRRGGTVGREILIHWEQFDLLVTATKSPCYLIHPKKLDGKKRLIFDLSVPRNVDPEIGIAKGVTLYNIEQLHQLVEERCIDLQSCKRMIQENVLRLCCSYRKKIRTQHVQEFEGMELHRECSPSLL